MARDLNKICLIGRLGKDPEMTFTPNGAAVTKFTLATGRQWKDASGEQHEQTEWHSIVAWQKLGEICNQYLTKGSRVYIEGRVETRSWDDTTSGEKKYRTEVIASDMIILDSRSEGGDRLGRDHEDTPAVPRPARKQVVDEDDLPF